jgi:polyhydroxybutyrate depolymerase
MKIFRRIIAFMVPCIVIVLIGLGISRYRRQQAYAATIAAAKLETIVINSSGLDRRTLVHFPVNIGGDAKLPLVLMFHGNGGTPENTVFETGWVDKADEKGFVIAFPEATRPDMTRPAKFGSNNPAWNDGSGRFHAGEQNIDDIAFVAMLLDHLEAKYPIDSKRIFATGFSNGASMTFRVGSELSNRISAIAPVSGALWLDEPKLEVPLSLLYITGTRDPLNPIEGGELKMAVGAKFKNAPDKKKPPVRDSVLKWAKLLECEASSSILNDSNPGLTTEQFPKGRRGCEIAYIQIHDHGHVWPGGKNLLPEFIVGKATNHLKAVDVIWDFFESHSR